MGNQNEKLRLLRRRRQSIRKKISGTQDRPRLRVSRSLKHIYAQLIDDTQGRTLAEASSVSLKINGHNVEAAKEVGKALAERAKAHKIEAVRFDRGGYRYHGRVKALADGAREGGLKL